MISCDPSKVYDFSALIHPVFQDAKSLYFNTKFICMNRHITLFFITKNLEAFMIGELKEISRGIDTISKIDECYSLALMKKIVVKKINLELPKKIPHACLVSLLLRTALKLAVKTSKEFSHDFEPLVLEALFSKQLGLGNNSLLERIPEQLYDEELQAQIERLRSSEDYSKDIRRYLNTDNILRWTHGDNKDAIDTKMRFQILRELILTPD